MLVNKNKKVRMQINVEYCDEKYLTIPTNEIIMRLHFQISIFNQ